MIITNDKVPLSGFNYLKVLCNGTTYTLNISGYTSESAYVFVEMWNDGQYFSGYMGITTEKNNFFTNNIRATSANELPSGRLANYGTYNFTKVWLE